MRNLIGFRTESTRSDNGFRMPRARALSTSTSTSTSTTATPGPKAPSIVKVCSARASDAWMGAPRDERPTVFRRPGVPDRDVERFAEDADLTVYWPWVRPCWEER